jgi:hypothetical protein
MDKPIFELKDIVNVKKPTLGLYLCSGPQKPPGVEEIVNQAIELNFTGKPGEASSLYYSLFFQLPKWGWYVAKVDEWIEVSPTHREYYERTAATKQMLESTIKTGLATAAQSVADYELMAHDLRKYKEILSYFAEGDEHVLRSMFVDQVDVHTDMPGQALSMRAIAPRWPTIIADFLSLIDDDTDIDKVSKKINISRAEAVILVTKNKLYIEWKKLFLDAAKTRYKMIRGLVEGRRKSIHEYRNWLKPYIARFRMTRLGGERAEVRAESLKSFADITGMATFSNNVRLFVWKPFKTIETRKPAAEAKGDFVLYPYDEYTRENLILGKKGLAKTYPWLRNIRKYCPGCKDYFPSGVLECPECGSLLIDRTMADEIVEKQILKSWKNMEMSLDPYELYYMFIDFDVLRVGTRLPVGEMEDITFTISNFVVSQNVLLVKILELKCREIELEHYIDEMLGVRVEDMNLDEILTADFPQFKEEKGLGEYNKFVKGLRDTSDAYTGFLKKVKTPKIKNLMFLKHGKYERDFKDRITKDYLKIAGRIYAGIVGFIKTQMGVG